MIYVSDILQTWATIFLLSDFTNLKVVSLISISYLSQIIWTNIYRIILK